MDRITNKSLLSDIERTLFYHAHGQGMAGRNEVDKAQDALIKTFIPEYDAGGLGGFSGIREAYIHLTGDDEFRGRAGFNLSRVSSGLRACADFDSGTFSFALQNALNMYLSKAYKSFPYHEEIFISEKKTATDFRTIQSLQLGYLGDLPDIDPETGDYQSLGNYGDTESQYKIGQKGGITWVTRKHVINDLVGLIKALLDRKARAARRTHAKYVWSFFINNAICPDGTAWFTAPHGNLGSSALDFDPLAAAITALADMVEPGSGEKLGMDLPTFNWNLVIPVALWKLAVSKNQAEYYYTAADDLTTKTENPNCRLFGDRNERIIICPFFTDLNDWGVIRDKEDVPIVEMSYLNGHEEPELVLAHPDDLPGTERGLHGDDYGYKIRHEYGGTLADHQGGFRSVVS